MYGFSIKLKPGFDRAIEQVTAVLKTESFGVLSDIDVQATLKAKPDVVQMASEVRAMLDRVCDKLLLSA